MSKLYPTPHINATPEDFAKTVLMPGDPLRAEFIAKNFLSDAKLVNNVRGVNGYTGFYNGTRVSVMASGMGMPSIGIYSHELYNFFGVENIIRVGSAGAMRADIPLKEIILAEGASTNSNYAKAFNIEGTFAPICSYDLLKAATSIADKSGLKYRVGNVLSSDSFYSDEAELPIEQRPSTVWAKMGVMAVEMEAAALYMNAARSGKAALAILTVSDNIVTGETTTAEERQTTFTDMIELALSTAKEIE